jgi:glycerate kinase
MKKNLTVILAFDSFKDSMTSLEAGNAFSKGFKRILPRSRVIIVPISDGGEGFTESLLSTGGKETAVRAVDPLGRPGKASFGIFDKGKKAVVEMARASGIELLKPSERNPWNTTTCGTGQLIGAALKRGAKKIIVGIGGSATNDGGTGMAQALGVEFLDKNRRPLPSPVRGRDLGRIRGIRLNDLPLRLKNIAVTAACDVKNPMTGKNGAAFVFSPQKGAPPSMVRRLDAGLKNLCRVIRRDIGKDVERVPGAGAAGGLGGGLLAFLNARLTPGISIVLENLAFNRLLKGADLVITGEGRMDEQTLNNKAPIGVARAAREKGVPVIALCGSLGKGSEKALLNGVSAAFSIVPGVTDLAGALKGGKRNMERTGENLARVMRIPS